METTSGTASCEIQLLAKDGIYLATAPRLITKAYITSGGRADIMVCCSGSGSVNFNAIVGTNVASQGTYVALKLTVVANSATSLDLSAFSVFRPCYLVDTRTSTPANSLSLTFGAGNPNTIINGEFFSGPDTTLNPTTPYRLGTLGKRLYSRALLFTVSTSMSTPIKCPHYLLS